MTKASIQAARELRDLVQNSIETRYARGTIALSSRRLDHEDSAGLAVEVGDQYLELHVYANMEQEL